MRLAFSEFAAMLPPEEAKPILVQLEKRPGLPVDKTAQLWLGLAAAHAHVKEDTEASRLYQQVCALPAYAQDVSPRLSRFDLALRAGDEPGMLRVLDEIKVLESADGLNAQYGLAVHHIWKARNTAEQGKFLSEAGIILDRLAQKRPNWSAVMLARAEIEEMRGNVDKALNHYRQALDQGERDPRAVRRYGQLLFKCHRDDEVVELVRKYEKVGSVSSELRQIAARVMERGAQSGRAGEITLPAVVRDSKDFRDVMWQGQILSVSGKYDDAERAFWRAAELAGEESDPWVALTRFYVTRGKKDRAEEVIRSALSKLPAEWRAVTVAQCYDTLGNSKQAATYYQQALIDRPTDVPAHRLAATFYLRIQDQAHAEPCLQKLIDAKLSTSPQDVSWAKQKLAVALALRGDFRRYGEALALVGLSLDQNGNPQEKQTGGTPPAEEVAARARVLATQGRASFRARAIALLEELNKREALLPEDRFLLAQLYESNGTESVWWVKAGEQMARLDKLLADDIGYLTQYATWRIRHKEYPQAQSLIDRIEKVEQQRHLPLGNLGSIELRVALLEATRRGDEALALLSDYVAKGKEDPERIFFLIGALQRRKRTADALDCCEKAWKTCPPEKAGGASLTTLKAGEAKLDQFRRVEEWLKAGLKKKQGSPVLLLQLADLYEMRGDLDKAEEKYREVLKQDKDNAVALNNLAWHLSQRPGRGAEALPLINRALELLGPQAALLDTRATVHLRMGRGDLALADMEKVARDDPSATRLFHLAQAQHLTNNTKGALRSFERAMSEGLDLSHLPPTDRESFQRLRAELQRR
jgi:tetratricopeptide (TPR) repeat protein